MAPFRVRRQLARIGPVRVWWTNRGIAWSVRLGRGVTWSPRRRR